MAFYFGSSTQGFLQGYRDQIDRMRTQRQKNKEAFDKWKSDALARGESLSVEDMIKQRETLAGGDNYFIGGLATDAQMKKMTQRHNTQVAQKIYDEATARMEAEVKRNDLYESTIPLDLTYSDWVKNQAPLFGGGEAGLATATQTFADKGGEEWFNSVQEQKRSDRINNLITNDSRYTRAESENDIAVFFANEPGFIVDQLKKAWASDEKKRVDTELEKLETYINGLDDTDLIYTDEETIKKQLQGKYPNIKPDALKGLVDVWRGRANGRKNALSEQQKASFLADVANSEKIKTLYGQKEFQWEQVLSEMNTLAKKYPHLDQSNWANEEAFEAWIGDPNWSENQMRYGYSGQYTAAEKEAENAALATAELRMQSSKNQLINLATVEAQTAAQLREKGETVPVEYAMFEKGGAGAIAMRTLADNYMITEGGHALAVETMKSLYQMDSRMSPQDLASTVVAVLQRNGYIQSLNDLKENIANQEMVKKGFTIKPGETVQNYSDHLLSSVEKIKTTILDTLKHAPRNDYFIGANGQMVLINNSGTQIKFKEAIKMLTQLRAEVSDDFNGASVDLFIDIGDNISIDGITMQGSMAGSRLVQIIDEEIESLRAAQKDIVPEVVRTQSLNPATGLATGVDIHNIGIDDNYRLLPDFDFAQANNQGGVYTEMKARFDAEPDMLEYAKRVVNNQNGDYGKAAILLRNLIQIPTFAQTETPADAYSQYNPGQGLAAVGSSFKHDVVMTSPEKEFYTRLAAMIAQGQFDQQ